MLSTLRPMTEGVPAPKTAGTYARGRTSGKGRRVTPSEIRVDVAHRRDVDRAVRKALKNADVTLEDLQAQAASGRFCSEQARVAWFAISPFVATRTRSSS